MTKLQQITDPDTYHYTDCGLSNIWLISGFERVDTPYGPATAIHNLDVLHRAIGRSIANVGSISAAEFRFLRVELDLSQRALAGLLKATEQQIHRWENNKTRRPIPGPAQIALAGYYLETIDPGSSMKETMDRLAQLDAELSELEVRYFELTSNEWILKPAA